MRLFSDSEKGRCMQAIFSLLKGRHFSKQRYPYKPISIYNNPPMITDRVHIYNKEFKDTLFVYEEHAQAQMIELIEKRLDTFLSDLEEECLKINPNKKQGDGMIDIDKFKEYCKTKYGNRNYRVRDPNTPPRFSELENYIKDNKITSPTGRYLIFSYEYYYPSGGMEDLLIRTDDIENFKNILRCLYDFDNDGPALLNYFDIDTNETIDLEEEMKNDRNS